MRRGNAATPSSTDRPARRRRWPWILGTLASLVAVAVLVALHYLQPAQLTAIILRRASDALKLDIRTTGPGSYALRPEPRLVLPGLSASVPGSKTPLFRSTSVEVALPWSTLRGKTTAVSSIVLKSPDIDVAALKAWLATRPPSTASFRFPTLTRGLQVTDGTLRGADWQLSRFDMALPSLADGRPATLDASGALRRGDVVSTFKLHATATPSGSGKGMRMDGATIAFASDGELPSLTASGSLRLDERVAIVLAGALQKVPKQWSDALDSAYATPGATPFALDFTKGPPLVATATDAADQILHLKASVGDPKRQPVLVIGGDATYGAVLEATVHGTLSRWPDALPALPPALGAAAPITFDASMREAMLIAEPVQFHVARGTTQLQGQFRLLALRSWLQKGRQGLPPIDASLATPRLEVDGVELQGVRLDIHDDAPASQTPAKPSAVAKPTTKLKS